MAANQVCRHVLVNPEVDYAQYFTGQGQDYALICVDCLKALEHVHDHLEVVCPKCFDEIAELGCWDAIHGRPEVLERPSEMVFTHRLATLPEGLVASIVDLQPLNALNQSVWIALTSAGSVLRITFDEHATIDELYRLPNDLSADTVHVASDGSFGAFYQRLGNCGAVVDLTTSQQTMVLQRDGYRSEYSPFPVAFFKHEERWLLIHATAWNRLDISDPATGIVLTQRTFTTPEGETRPDHYLDYFHGQLTVSPNDEWVVDNGWVWAPCGLVTSWSLRDWLTTNPWESEDGDSKQFLCQRWYFWDGPLCWLDNRTVAVWGYGGDDDWLIPAVCVFDVVSGKRLRWIAGTEANNPARQFPAPKTREALVFDGYLVSISSQTGVQVWDVETGARLHTDPSFAPLRYHRGTREFLTLLEADALQLSRLG